jgi:hypothetical protein
MGVVYLRSTRQKNTDEGNENEHICGEEERGTERIAWLADSTVDKRNCVKPANERNGCQASRECDGLLG